jgi:putative ABC transport system permease protein
MAEGPSWLRWVQVFRSDPRSEVEEELRHHLEQRVADYVARGMDPESARRAAVERLGDLTRVRNECATLLSGERKKRERRVRLSVSWLDVKLGVRMLAKYPGLSVVSVLGMAVAIAIGAGYYAGYGAMLDSALPLDEGERVVGLHPGLSQSGSDSEVSVHDYVAWRDAMSTVRELGAFRSQHRNLIIDDGRTELVEVAAITASGFQVARVSPAIGRPLLAEDERAGAAPVIVIAHEEWRRVFDSNPNILGELVRVGETVHTVVGVMPEGFRFPINHRYWVPLVLDAAIAQPTDAPSLHVFGRLADGVTLERARAELATIGARMAAAFPATHEHIRPIVLPYVHLYRGFEALEADLVIRAIRLALSLLLVIVALNVAILVYARTATRTGEIAVRNALGASRRRVVAQLFVEALVLSVAASAIGLTLVGIALRLMTDWVQRGGEVPFWIDLGLTPGTILYVALLAIIAAAIVGVLPALKATGKRLQQGLQQFSSRGSAMQLGRTWSALIVVQVAGAVAALPAAILFAEETIWLGIRAPSPAAHGLLRSTLVMQREGTGNAADSARFADRAAELIRRIDEQPEVVGVSFADDFPGRESNATIEVEPVVGPAADTIGQPASGLVEIRSSRIATNLFDVFRVPLIAGRMFVPADTRAGATAVIVSETFAQQFAGGASVLGRHIRYAERGENTQPGPWLEIVGVVPDFANDFTPDDDVAPRLFHAAAAGDLHRTTLIVRIAGGEPAPLATRLRTLAANVDPTLTLEAVETVTSAWQREQQFYASLSLMVIAVMLSVLLLSAAGIYALMSFTVAKRRREIGLRSALGAEPHRIIMSVFARAGAQIGAGVLAGVTLVAALWALDDPGGRLEDDWILLPAVAALMIIVGLLAAFGPARRGLAVQPTEALREE